MRLLTPPALAGLILAGAINQAGGAATTQSSDVGRTARSPAMVLAMSEVRIQQATGRLPHGKLPELGTQSKNASANAANAANKRPITCDSSNATSPDCYTATQQSRPIAK